MPPWLGCVGIRLNPHGKVQNMLYVGIGRIEGATMDRGGGMRRIDAHADLGEGFDPRRTGGDAAMTAIVTGPASGCGHDADDSDATRRTLAKWAASGTIWAYGRIAHAGRGAGQGGI